MPAQACWSLEGTPGDARHSEPDAALDQRDASLLSGELRIGLGHGVSTLLGVHELKWPLIRHITCLQHAQL